MSTSRTPTRRRPPPPSPAEVFRCSQTLPLPALTTRQQPPGEALVALPVVFCTDSPTTQTSTTTCSVDGGVSAEVPGTTTTQGAPATFTVLQARPVLTSPYD